jgi:citrate synthase/citryl-CoA lyase
MMDAILISIVDHGPTPVSTLAARTVASSGAGLNASVAAGILAIAKHHGGAIGDCMQVLRACASTGLDAPAAAAATVADFRKRGARIPGFGHRQHSSDPRTERLFEIAIEEGIADNYETQARAIQSVLRAETGKAVPINADGAIAAILCAIDFPQEAANGLFMIARVAGLVAHVVEEQARCAPLQPIHPTEYEYDGPPARELGTGDNNIGKKR